jgi:hypothetical protein
MFSGPDTTNVSGPQNILFFLGPRVKYLFCDDMEEIEGDFALRYVRIYPDVNSRAGLVTLVRRFALLVRG